MTPEEALNIAKNLSCWNSSVSASALEGGITNHNILVEGKDGKFVVRLGDDIPEHGIMRWHELSSSLAAHAAGVSPGIHHAEPGVLVLEFIDSKPLGEADLHDAKVLGSVVQLVKQSHLELPKHIRGNVLSFWVFHILRDYAATLREKASTHVAKLDDLLDEAARLENIVGPIELVFGHNDLLPANILDDGSRYWLIDWEYGGFNSPLFDLGGLASNCALEPDAEHTMLSAYYGEPPNKDLWRRYSAMKCASLLRETMWSMVSEITSEIEFDYSEYTAKNIARYREAYSNFLKEGS
jgi:thiamine kinase-like enzyme